MNDQVIIENPNLSKELIKVVSSAIPGKTKADIRLELNALIDSGAFSLREELFCRWIKNKRGFLSLRDLDTDEVIFQADFLNGRCIGYLLTVSSDRIYDCMSAIRADGFKFETRFKRFIKPGTPFTFRTQRIDENSHLVICRKLFRKANGL